MALKRFIIKLAMSQTKRAKLIMLSSVLVFIGFLFYHFFFKSNNVVPIYVVEEHHEGKILIIIQSLSW